MIESADNTQIISDISLLYELSLAVGNSLDLRKNCEMFLGRLMARKNLAYASVWIKSEYLPDQDGSAGVTLVYASPESRVKERQIPDNHPLLAQLANQTSFSLTSADSDFSKMVTEKDISRGAFAIFALGKIGVLKLHSTRAVSFGTKELRQLSQIIDKFTLSLEACFAHQRSLQEISERKRAEESVRQNEELLRSIIDATPDWIFIKDREHRYRLANQGYAEALHMKPEDFIGKNDLELGFPEELVKGDPEQGIRGFWADDRLVMDSGEAQVYPNDPATIDGVVHTFNTIKTPLRDANGDIWGVLAFARDVTEREEMLTEMQESQELLRLIIDATPDWIFIKDREHRYRLANQSYADSFHIKPEEFIGKNDLEIGFPEDIVKGNPEKGIVGFWADDRAVMESGESKYIEIEPAVVDDKSVWLSTRKVPLRDANNNVWGVLGFVHNITALENNRQLIAKRATELETVTKVGIAASTTLDVNELLQQVANLTKDSFGLYHAHIYLLNEAGDTLTLTAGAGDVGRQMVKQGWNIPLQREQSLVASAARTWQGIIVNNVRETPNWLPNPLLPDTHAELAVPMIVGDQLLGVLDVQAAEVNYFSEDDVRIQTTLATQVAVALQNARLFEHAQRQARQEQILREVTAQVRGASDPEAVVRASLRALGDALGRPTFVRLTKPDQLPTEPDPGNGQKNDSNKKTG